MAKSCAVIPKVLNNKGEKVDSKLFKDLLSYLNSRVQAIKVYQITKSQKFIQEWNPRLSLDDNNEPTIRSMLQKTNLSHYIPTQKVLDKLNRDIGYYKKGMERPALWVKNHENYKKLAEKARDFNKNSDFSDEYVARIVDIPDWESGRTFIGVKVEKRNRLNSIEADKLEYNEALNEKLRKILASHGIAIGALTELEKRMGINGVTDFDQAKAAAEGMIELIRLAEGLKGERVLPEEFAHFVIEAMGNDNPLINRLINLIISKDLAKEIIGETFEEYNASYDNDEVKLAKEAAGKLLAKHLLQEAEVPSKPYKTLLERIISSIKNFFRRLDANSIQKAMIQADKAFGNLARDILSGSLDNQIDVRNITGEDKYFNISERVKRDKKLVQSIISNELKRLKIYESRNPDSEFGDRQKALLLQLEESLAKNNEIEGIYAFTENALDTFRQLSTRLATIQNTPGVSINDKARTLRDVRNYLYSYKRIVKDIRAALIDEERHEDNRWGERARVTLDSLTGLLSDLFIEYNNVAMPLFVDFIKPFIGESIAVPFGKWKGKRLDDFIRKKEDGSYEIIADKDISFFDRWLDSMADSSSPILRIIDQAVKKSKGNARLRTIELAKEIQAAAIRLEQAGIKNTDWMFERDSQGNLTGNYISEINQGLFKEKVREMYKRLNEKYGKNPVGNDSIEYNKERRAWFDANMEVVNGKRVPKLSIYGNIAFRNLSAAQKTYYRTIMDIKGKLDSYLPSEYTTLTNAVKIRKDLLERVKSADGVKSGARQIWEDIKDQFIRRSDDTEFGDRATVKDFEGNEVQVLPIYYTKLREGESPNDMSTDVTSTLIAYAAMANDFNEMNKIINVLELSRDMLRDNLSIKKTRGGKPLVERFEAMGRTVEGTVIKSNEDKRIIQRLNDYFEMQVYGRYMADEGTFGKSNIDKGKIANFVNRVTALNSYALNVLSGISNVATGSIMMRIESFSKEFFTEKNTIIADREYGKAMPAFLAEIGNRIKTSKLALFSELFNIPQEYEADVREVNFDRKTWFARMFGTKALFFMSNVGEHWMQHRTALALADSYKMKGPNNETVSLWEALEVEYIDPNNKALGARLKVKEGYTKKDGTKFTKEDIIKFSRKAAAINQRMHGIYNKLDRSAVQRLGIGRMGMMYRKWIKPSLNRRFKSAAYNLDLEAWTEGYYNTTGGFLLQLAKELREGKFAIAANWKHLTKTEKSNIRRALTEVGHFLAIALILGLIDWPDDEDRPWAIKMTEYQLRRLYTELGSMVPGPQMAKEGLKIMKSPAAGINTVDNALDLIGLFNPYNYETFVGEEALIKSGRWKDQSRATKLFYESPVIPMNKTIYRGLHPEEGVPFYK